MEEDKKNEQVTDGTVVEVRAVSLKGVKEKSSSSKEKRRNLTEKEEDEDEIEGLEAWEEDELMNGRVLEEEEILRGRYVDEVEGDGLSEEDILRAAAQMPFEEESLEEETMECTPHPFTKDIQEEILKDFQDELEGLQELEDEEQK